MTTPFHAPSPITPKLTDHVGMDSHKTTTGKIYKEILCILSDDEQNLLLEKNILFQKLLHQLDTEIARKQKEIGYRYDDYFSYQEKLLTSDDELNRVWQEEILGDTKIQEFYEAILLYAQTPEMKAVLRELLRREYFENIVYELIAPLPEKITQKHSLREIFDYIEGKSISFPYPQPIQDGTRNKPGEIPPYLLEYLDGIENLRCEITDYGLFNIEILELIICHGTQIKKVDFWKNQFNAMDEEQFKIIFENLHHIKAIDLGSTDVCEVNESRLRRIVEVLKHVSIVNINQNQLDKLEEENLRMIFENLYKVKSIDLSQTSLHLLTEQKLKVIFENLGKVIQLNLSENNLDTLDLTRLKIIFENLKNTKIIFLGSMIQNCNEAQLKIIFGNLKYIKKVYLSVSQDFIDKIFLFFPHLVGKITNFE